MHLYLSRSSSGTANKNSTEKNHGDGDGGRSKAINGGIEGLKKSKATIGDVLESLSHFIFGSLAFVALAILHYFYDSLRGQQSEGWELQAAARPATGHSYFFKHEQTLTKTNAEGSRESKSRINMVEPREQIQKLNQ